MEVRAHVCQAAQVACLLEATAPKMGNVNRRHDFHDCFLEDFLLAGLAAGPVMGRAGGRPLGLTVYEAVEASRKVTPVNANLGIILLMAPLAKAWTPSGDIGLAVQEVLETLDQQDAEMVYAAIRLASPGGLGSVQKADVGQEPDTGLREAMSLAASWDLVAREYSTGFDITLRDTRPRLEESLKRGLPMPQAIAHAHLYLLAKYGDSLIQRKRGVEAAARVREMAAAAWSQGGFLTREGLEGIRHLDFALRVDRNDFNPGTTADLVTAGLFLMLLEEGLGLWLRHRPRESRQGFGP
ncbi:MAG: triphosphoribosyl-dephospho-CoA synthase [Bacillota bacterium]